MSKEIEKLGAQIAQLKAYLLTKVEQADWHGVADAAMDLRELERELKVRLELEIK